MSGCRWAGATHERDHGCSHGLLAKDAAGLDRLVRTIGDIEHDNVDTVLCGSERAAEPVRVKGNPFDSHLWEQLLPMLDHKRQCCGTGRHEKDDCFAAAASAPGGRGCIRSLECQRVFVHELAYLQGQVSNALAAVAGVWALASLPAIGWLTEAAMLSAAIA